MAGCYLRYYAEMAEAVRSGAPVPVDPGDAIAALDIIEAAKAAAARGQVVVLGDPAR